MNQCSAFMKSLYIVVNMVFSLKHITWDAFRLTSRWALLTESILMQNRLRLWKKEPGCNAWNQWPVKEGVSIKADLPLRFKLKWTPLTATGESERKCEKGRTVTMVLEVSRKQFEKVDRYIRLANLVWRIANEKTLITGVENSRSEMSLQRW